MKFYTSDMLSNSLKNNEIIFLGMDLSWTNNSFAKFFHFGL